MKVAAVIDHKVTIINQAMPVPKEPLVVIRVVYAGACTEYKGYINNEQFTYPYRGVISGDCCSLGHEAVGYIEESHSEGYEVGDRVVVQPLLSCGKCRFCQSGDYIFCPHGFSYEDVIGSSIGTGSYAQYLLKPSWLLTGIPDDIDFKYAMMALCGFGPAYGAYQRMLKAGNGYTLVVGCGPVGLGAIILGKHYGENVIAIAKHEYRGEIAKSVGADIVFMTGEADIESKVKEVVIDSSGGPGYILECSGSESGRALALACAGIQTEIALIGQGGSIEAVVTPQINLKGISIHGIWHYNLKGYEHLMQIMRENRSEIDEMVTHILPMSQVERAWELQSSKQCGKVLIDPWS